MSPKTHKSEYTILAVLGLVTGVVLFWMAWGGLLREPRAGVPGVRTTRSTNVDGLLVCYSLLERLDIPVDRSSQMLLSNRLRDMGTVLVLDPLVPLGVAEIADVGAWLARGGVLITTEVLADLAPALRRLAQDLPASPRRRTPAFEEGQLANVPEKNRALPLARDVSTACFATNRVLCPEPADPNAAPSGIEPLFADEHGVRIAQWKVGRGRLILLSDSSFLANRYIGRGDNAVLAANLISCARAGSNGPKVVFSEYHFGGGRGEGLQVLAGMLFTTPPGWAVLALTAAGILFLLYKGRQFGPRRELGRQRRRSKLEYVRAVGATYRTAGAHRLTLQLIYAWFRQQLATRTGLAVNIPNPRLAEELARRGRSKAMDYQRILDGCDRVLSRSKISQRQLTSAVEQLARIEKETLNGSHHGNRPGR